MSVDKKPDEKPTWLDSKNPVKKAVAIIATIALAIYLGWLFIGWLTTIDNIPSPEPGGCHGSVNRITGDDCGW